MNILYDYQILIAQKYGGISRYYYELASRLNSMDEIKVSIPTILSQNYYFESFFHKRSIEHYARGVARPINAINKVNTVCTLKSNKYDIVHPTYYNPYILDKSKGKLVITVYDMIHEIYSDYFLQNDETSAYKKKMIFAADKIIAISHNTKNDILSLYPQINQEKIDVIYLGNSILNSEEKKTKNVQLPKRYILFVGSRWGYKNFGVFFKAIQEIFQEDKEIELVCAGGGCFNNEENEMINRAVTKNRVYQFDLNDDELAAAYHNAVCFVFPSKYEGFGIPILESFSNQCPAILSNTSSFPEIGGEAALYINPDEKEDIAEKIWLLMKNSEKRKQMIKLGLTRSKMFSWDVAAMQTLEAYKVLL